jgi:hypothetical protein
VQAPPHAWRRAGDRCSSGGYWGCSPLLPLLLLLLLDAGRSRF